MATITCDSLRVSDKLKSAGFTAEQAEAVVRVIAEARDDLVTRKDLAQARCQTQCATVGPTGASTGS